MIFEKTIYDIPKYCRLTHLIIIQLNLMASDYHRVTQLQTQY